MEDSVPVTVMTDHGEEDDVDSVSSVEIKARPSYNQIKAQTIVFSFYQQKYNKEKMKTCLVPGIGISTEELYFVFYDSEYDVLLESAPLFLCGKGTLVTNRVVFLWLTLNYKLFCSGITAEMKSCPSIHQIFSNTLVHF